MPKLLRFGLLMSLVLAAVLPMAAQVRHVTTVNPMTKQSYMEVYEFDYVDIQPQCHSEKYLGLKICNGGNGKWLEEIETFNA